MRLAILTTDNRGAFQAYDQVAPCFGTAPAALLQGLARLQGIEVHVVSCLQQPVPIPEQIIDNIHYHTLHVPPWGWMKTGYLGCIRAVRKKLKEIRPDIVHGQGTERDCALSAVFSGFPNVLTIHGNMRSIAAVNRARPFSFYWLAAKLEGFTLPRTDGVVCITRYTQAAVQSLVRQTWVAPNAVDQSFFDITAQPETTQPPIALFIGTVCFHKNQNEFIRAMDALAARIPFKIIFAGEAAKNDYGLEFLKLVETRPWCQFVGWTGRDELKKYFQTASFLVLPTREDNCPMVVLEAMATGVPVMASNIGGIPDLILPEKTGLFCDPEKPETFVAGVERLLQDSALRDRLAAAAKMEARERFHPEVVARRHLDIYREILKKQQIILGHTILN